jgi:hypothetical protein
MARKQTSLWLHSSRHQSWKGARNIVSLAMLLFLCAAANVFAQTTTFAPDDDSDTPSQPRQYFFGDWGGERTSLASKWVTFEFSYVAGPAGERCSYDWTR